MSSRLGDLDVKEFVNRNVNDFEGKMKTVCEGSFTIKTYWQIEKHIKGSLKSNCKRKSSIFFSLQITMLLKPK